MERQAGKVSEIGLPRHHWQTMGIAILWKQQPVFIIKKDKNRFHIVPFFPSQLISGIEFLLFTEVCKSNAPEGSGVSEDFHLLTPRDVEPNDPF